MFFFLNYLPMNNMTRIVLLITISTTLAINLKLQPRKQRCFYLESSGEYYLSFIFSGVRENYTSFHITHGADHIAQLYNITEHTKVYNIPVGGAYFCWTNIDFSQKRVSVELFPTDSVKMLAITKQKVGEYIKSLDKVVEELTIVRKNQLFQYQRDAVHRTVLQQTDQSIVIAGVFKIGLLLTSVGLQIWVMRGFFNNSRVSYTQVASS